MNVNASETPPVPAPEKPQSLLNQVINRVRAELPRAREALAFIATGRVDTQKFSDLIRQRALLQDYYGGLITAQDASEQGMRPMSAVNRLMLRRARVDPIKGIGGTDFTSPSKDVFIGAWEVVPFVNGILGEAYGAVCDINRHPFHFIPIVGRPVQRAVDMGIAKVQDMAGAAGEAIRKRLSTKNYYGPMKPVDPQTAKESGDRPKLHDFYGPSEKQATQGVSDAVKKIDQLKS